MGLIFHCFKQNKIEHQQPNQFYEENMTQQV